MNLAEIILSLRNIGNLSISWDAVATNVKSIKLTGSAIEGYKVEFTLKS